MVKIRLRRIGRKKLPIYQVVAADSRAPRDGKFLEDLGRYEPKKSPHTINLKEQRILYWLKTGAQPTETVLSLIRSTGMLYKQALKKQGKSEDEISNELKAFLERKSQKYSNAQDRKKKARQKKKIEKQKTENKETENAEGKSDASTEKKSEPSES